MERNNENYKAGNDVEIGVLGEVAPPARLTIEQYREYKEKKERGEVRHISDEEAVEIVKANQPPENQKPGEPGKRFPSDVHATVAKALGLKNYEQLRYYTAVSSLLDKYKKDAFFELHLRDGQLLRVTLDITIDESKLAEKTADVVFLWPADGLDLKNEKDQKTFEEKVKEVAEVTIAAFRSKELMEGLAIESLDPETVVKSVEKSKSLWKEREAGLTMSRKSRHKKHTRLGSRGKW